MLIILALLTSKLNPPFYSNLPFNKQLAKGHTPMVNVSWAFLGGLSCGNSHKTNEKSEVHQNLSQNSNNKPKDSF